MAQEKRRINYLWVLLFSGLGQGFLNSMEQTTHEAFCKLRDALRDLVRAFSESISPEYGQGWELLIVSKSGKKPERPLVLFCWGKFWKGVYLHFPKYTYRFYFWGIDRHARGDENDELDRV